MKYWLVPLKEINDPNMPDGKALATDCEYPCREIHGFPDERGVLIACEQQPAKGKEIDATDEYWKAVLESHGEQL